jgi:hypothetical protein
LARASRATRPPVPGDAAAPTAKPPRTAATYRLPGANLLKKVFAVDVLACPASGGRLQVIAFIAEAPVAKRHLDHLGLDASGPPLSRARAPPELFDAGPSYQPADPA